jgi:hypothetical protein
MNKPWQKKCTIINVSSQEQTIAETAGGHKMTFIEQATYRQS